MKPDPIITPGRYECSGQASLQVIYSAGAVVRWCIADFETEEDAVTSSFWEFQQLINAGYHLVSGSEVSTDGE
jgi:hypothetical protein